MRPWSRIFLSIAVAFALAAACAASRAANVLLVISSGTINASESARRTSFQGWGHTVATIEDNASQASFDTAVASADVVYVAATIQDWELLYKLRTAAKGVITETPGLDTEFGFTTSDGYTESTTQVLNVVNTHPVTAGLSSGTVTIVSSSQSLAPNGNSMAAGMTKLGERGGGQLALGVVDVGGALANAYSGNSTASGRRVRLPWADITWSALNSSGLTIAQQAISWAAGGTDSLLLHLKLNESSGTTADDSSTYNRDGTATGTATWIAGRRHNAFDFNGSTKIEVNSLLGSPTSFTLACWARIDATDTSGAEGVTLGDYVLLRPHDVSNGAPVAHFYYGGGSYRTVVATSSYIGRGWHHFAATFDDVANSFRLYIDGALVATTSTTSSVSWSGLGTMTRVGTHGNTNTNLDMDGAIDDVRVYNKALTQSEIADLYGLVGHWKLTETSGTTATDSSTKALHGTYANGPTLAQAGPYPGNGQNAASFDGANDVVNGAASTNYADFADGFSVAGWVYFNAFLNNVSMLENGSTTENFALSFSGSGQVRVQARNTSSTLQSMTTTATLPLGAWKHVVGTYDGSAFRVYIDGQLASTTNNAFTIGTASGNLSLGASLQGTDEFLSGRLHDVRLYNRAIAADEVAALYGLTGFWKLDESSGTVAADSSGSGYNGAYGGAPTVGKTGAYVRATGFSDSGTTDQLAASHLAIHGSTSASASFWIKTTHTGEQGVISGSNASESNEFLCLIFNSTTFRTYFHGATLTWTTPSLSDGRWHNVIVVANAVTGMTTAYFDGVSLGAQAGGSGGTAFNLASGGLIFGQEQDSVGGGFAVTQRVRGDLDELRIYNRPLSAQEIADLSGLVGHWKFDEGAGTTFADSSGASRNGAFNAGAPTWVTGVRGTALNFNGSSDALTDTAFNSPSTGTVAYWFRSTGPPAAQQRHFGNNADWEVWQNPDGIVRFDLCTDGEVGGFKTVSTPQTAARWYHLCAVYDSTDESYSIYINGELDKSGISSSDLTARAAGRLAFGNRTGAANYLIGALDDFRVYNRKLTQPEVYELYGLVGWYKLDETVGTVAANSTGLGSEGTYSGSPALGVANNGYTPLSTAVGFSGSNNVQIAGLFNRPTDVTASAWVRLDGVDSTGAEVVSLGDCFTIRLNSGTSGVAAYYFNGSTSVTATGNQILINSGWRHVAAVLLGGNTLKVYVDGIEVASTATSGAISYSGRGANSRIATHGNSLTTADLVGRVDEVKVYNRALPPDEIYQLYRGSRINGIKILQWVEAR
jgi:hypothetical protein